MSLLLAIAVRISGCSRSGGTQILGTLVERIAASVLLSHTRQTACPRLCRPTASAATGGQSPPPRALISATIEKGHAILPILDQKCMESEWSASYNGSLTKQRGERAT